MALGAYLNNSSNTHPAGISPYKSVDPYFITQGITKHRLYLVNANKISLRRSFLASFYVYMEFTDISKKFQLSYRRNLIFRQQVPPSIRLLFVPNSYKC